MASCLSLFLFVLGLALGQWQLGRAVQKIAMRDAIAESQAKPPLDNGGFLAMLGTHDLLYRRVKLMGSWLPDATVFLDNRTMNGRVGFVVVTPLKLELTGQVVLIQRGWVARNFVDRQALPSVASSSAVVQIEGMVSPPPSRHFDLGGGDIGRIRQNLDMKTFGDTLGLDLVPMSVQETGDKRDGLARNWPQPNTGVDTHYGYAFQWFALSGLVALYYLWFQIVKRFRRNPV
ncbi:MAG: SURF1 family protein [Rhodoferax sp.]|nr:SURF1 family protein [Rhodoferax sp.]